MSCVLSPALGVVVLACHEYWDFKAILGYIVNSGSVSEEKKCCSLLVISTHWLLRRVQLLITDVCHSCRLRHGGLYATHVCSQDQGAVSAQRNYFATSKGGIRSVVSYSCLNRGQVGVELAGLICYQVVVG